MGSEPVEPLPRGPVTSEALERMKCPACGSVMSHGYIAGHWIRLRWTEEEKTRTIFAVTKMHQKIDWWASPTLEAVRCQDCKIGIFRYDY
ncbi:MAG: PF20097 family protein [Pirellulales bacterium]